MLGDLAGWFGCERVVLMMVRGLPWCVAVESGGGWVEKNFEPQIRIMTPSAHYDLLMSQGSTKKWGVGHSPQILVE